MAQQLDVASRNAMGDALIAQFGSNAVMRIYDGTPPANLAAALSGNNVLVELPASATFAPATSAGTITANAFTTTNASASGTPSFARILTSGGTPKWQGTVGVSGSGADAIISHSPITSGDPIAVTSLTITMPGA